MSRADGSIPIERNLKRLRLTPTAAAPSLEKLLRRPTATVPVTFRANPGGIFSEAVEERVLCRDRQQQAIGPGDPRRLVPPHTEKQQLGSRENFKPAAPIDGSMLAVRPVRRGAPTRAGISKVAKREELKKRTPLLASGGPSLLEEEAVGCNTQADYMKRLALR